MNALRKFDPRADVPKPRGDACNDSQFVTKRPVKATSTWSFRSMLSFVAATLVAAAAVAAGQHVIVSYPDVVAMVWASPAACMSIGACVAVVFILASKSGPPPSASRRAAQ